MNKIDDIVAFALNQPDYLLEFLTGNELPNELDTEEQQALVAAREHVEAALAKLMGNAANAVADAIGAAQTNYQSRALLQNRLAAVKIPASAGKILYRMLVTLEIQPKQPARLLVSLETKKAYQSRVLEIVVAQQVPHSLAGYRITGEGIELREGDEFADLSGQLAKQGTRLFECVQKLVDGAV